MSVEDCFQLNEENRKKFIDKNIMSHLTNLGVEPNKDIKDRVTGIVNKYVGVDINALSVLAYATEQGKLGDFIIKLDRHYEEVLMYVHPEARRNSQVPSAVRTEQFFLECYKELGIKPQTN